MYSSSSSDNNRMRCIANTLDALRDNKCNGRLYFTVFFLNETFLNNK